MAVFNEVVVVVIVFVIFLFVAAVFLQKECETVNSKKQREHCKTASDTTKRKH